MSLPSPVKQAAANSPTVIEQLAETQFTFSIAPELLDRVDEIAHRKHVSRSALLTMWINDRLEHEAT